jgi:hypothetical protein
MAGEAGDGLSLNEDRPDIDQPYGDGYTELQHIKKGLRIRLEKEHNCDATTMAVNSSGGEHLAGSAKNYIGDYSVAWPTKRPDGSTDLDSDDYGRMAVDTTTSPNRIAIYTASGWTLLGTLIGSEIVLEDLKLSKIATDPTNAADYGFIYTKDVGDPAVTELFYVDSEGNSLQFTSGGKFNLTGNIPADAIDQDDIRLQNNSYLTARNAADDGDVDLIKANADDLPEISEQLVLSGGADLKQQETKNFVIENRTTDPTTPVTGQIWLRTDL